MESIAKVTWSSQFPSIYTDYINWKIKDSLEKDNGKNKEVTYSSVSKYMYSYYSPIYPTSTLLSPFKGTKNLQSKLKYDMSPEDILRANYVHLMIALLVQNPTIRSRPFWGVIIAAITHLLEDEGIEHKDPYELRIDAGIISKDLEPIDNRPYGDLTGQIIM